MSSPARPLTDDAVIGEEAPSAALLDDAGPDGFAVPDRPSRTGARGPARLLRAPGSPRMRHPAGRRHYAALAVADVDLDRGTATALDPVGPPEHPAEGVHALVWFHGEPIGELTVPGDPATVLATLPEVAARELDEAVVAHLLRDALAAPHGVAHASARGLAAVGHPEGTLPDGSEITVAVCTRDRPDDLRRCLAAIGRLTTAPADVLVVDNASRDDRTRRVAEEFGVRYVREPRAGLDWARNRALLEATTRIVAFTDDDVLVHPCWTAGLHRTFAEEPDAVLVTGLVAPAELGTPAQVMFEALGGFGRGYARKWMSVAVGSGEVAARLYPGTGGAGTGANMAVLRERALALGGFDPALDVGTPTGGGGDLEMYFRVLASGGLLVYEPTAVVRHVHRRTMPELVRQIRGNGTGSYSIFAGAGLRYGVAQARALAAFGWRWAARRHVRAAVRSLLWPRMWPPSLTLAETTGMVAAVLGRYYARARAQAAEQSARHPHEPGTPSLVHPRPGRRARRGGDPVVHVDLLRENWTEASRPPAGRDARATPRLRIRVARDGWPQADLSVRTGGAWPSSARLRWEVVGGLGPAVLAPGRNWADVAAGTRGCDDILRPVADRPARGRQPALLDRSVSVLVTVEHSPPKGLEAALADIEQLPGVEVVRAAGLHRVGARNAALPTLTGDVVVFVDGDVIPAEGWLDALLEPFADPSVSAVTGNVLPAEPADLAAQLLEDSGRLGGGPHRRVYDGRWLRRSVKPAATWRIGGLANAAVRRDVLDDVGPFDEALGAEADAEYLYRILRADGRIVYQPTAVVLRDHRADGDPLPRRWWRSAAGQVAYHLEILTRHGDPRGLLSLAVAMPRQYARRGWWILRGRDDYPLRLLAAETGGFLAGIPTWLRRRTR